MKHFARLSKRHVCYLSSRHVLGRILRVSVCEFVRKMTQFSLSSERRRARHDDDEVFNICFSQDTSVRSLDKTKVQITTNWRQFLSTLWPLPIDNIFNIFFFFDIPVVRSAQQLNKYHLEEEEKKSSTIKLTGYFLSHWLSDLVSWKNQWKIILHNENSQIIKRSQHTKDNIHEQ